MRVEPGSATLRRALILCVFVLFSAGLGMNRVAAHLRGRAVQHYRPDEATPRLTFLGDTVADAMLIRDFAADDDNLYLLDVVTPRVIALRETGGHWRVNGGFGRRGGGPGELMEPTGLAIRGDTMLVVDGGRIHYFTRSGDFIRTRAPVLPCRLNDARLQLDRDHLLVSGRCLRGDTVTTELVRIGADDVATGIASDPLYSLSGKVGSPLAWSITFTAGADHGLFGGGTGDCIIDVPFAGMGNGEARAPRRSCGLGRQRYAFVASDEYVRKSRAIAESRPYATGALAVPQFLPAYIGSLPTARGDFILRPYSTDSLAFRLVGSDDDVMIAGIDGFVGCRAAGCVWVKNGPVTEVMFVPAAVVEGASPGSIVRHR
jgi:hypothetical protein